MNIKNGINKTFSIDPNKYDEETIKVFINGSLIEFETNVDGQTIITSTAPDENDIVTISYFDVENHLDCISF